MGRKTAAVLSQGTPPPGVINTLRACPGRTAAETLRGRARSTRVPPLWARGRARARRGSAGPRRRDLPRAHAAILPPLLELSKWPPGLATRPTRVSAQTRGHGRGPPAIFLADLGQPRASCLRPPPAAPAPRGLGALLVTKGVGPGSARVYTKCECLKRILALLGLVPHCGTQVCAGDSLFFSPETRGAGTGPRPSGAGCASPGGGARRWLLRASDSRGKPTGGVPGCPKSRVGDRNRHSRHLLGAYCVLYIALCASSAELYHKASQASKCIVNAISQGVARVCFTLDLGLGRRVRAFLVTQVKTQPLHRPDLGIAQPPGCRPASPLLETSRAELGCRQTAPPPIPWLWPLTLPPARPPTREPVPTASSCSRRGR